MAEMIDAKKTLEEAGSYQLRIADLDEEIVDEKEKLKDLREEREANVQSLLKLLEEARTGQGRLFNRPDPEPEEKPIAKPKKAAKKRENPWAGLTTEQRQARVDKMLAGRGLKRRPAKKAK